MRQQQELREEDETAAGIKGRRLRQLQGLREEDEMRMKERLKNM